MSDKPFVYFFGNLQGTSYRTFALLFIAKIRRVGRRNTITIAGCKRSSDRKNI